MCQFVINRLKKLSILNLHVVHVQYKYTLLASIIKTHYPVKLLTQMQFIYAQGFQSVILTVGWQINMELLFIAWARQSEKS